MYRTEDKSYIDMCCDCFSVGILVAIYIMKANETFNKEGQSMLLSKFLCGKEIKNIKLKIPYQARVRDLINIFDTVTGIYRLPTALNEEILEILFQKTQHVEMKLIEIAKLLIPFKIEICLTLLDATEQVVCEIKSYRKAYAEKFIRVLNYLSDGTHGLTRVITF